MKFSELQEKLTKILGRKITQADISAALNMHRSSITKSIQADRELNVNHKARIEQFFEINLDTGENFNTVDELLSLPVCGDIEASLGNGRDIFSEEVTEKFCIPKSLMKKIGASPTDSCIINTAGSSMYPTIIGGQDQILIDLSKKEIYDGKIYVFRMENTLFAKRLQKLPKNKIKVISDNPDYESYIIDLNDESIDFDIIGRVMWISRPC